MAKNEANSSQSKLPHLKNLVAVSSGKGGVGKSTVAVNLALSLAREGKKVGLLDADMHGPNTPTILGVSEMPQVVQGENEKEESFIPPEAHGVKVMSMGFLMRPEQPLIWRGPMLHKAAQQFFYNVQWGELDCLIIDMPPGTGDIQLSLAQLVPVTGAVLVTTPQEVAMQDVRKAYAMWERVNVPLLGLVENMSYFQCDGCDKQHFIFGEGGGEILATKYQTPLLGKLPMTAQLRESSDLGRSLVIDDSEGVEARAFQALAQQLLNQLSFDAPSEDSSEEIEIGEFE